MTEAFFPVAAQTPLAQRQDAGPQVGNMPLGQDEIAAVVDDQLQAAILMAEVPTDPAITRGALERGGGKAEESHPCLTPGGDVPERFADLRQRTQVVVLSHQILVTPLLEWTNRPDNDFMQVQWSLPSQNTLRLPLYFIGEDTTS
jgi:hypothetical protein